MFRASFGQEVVQLGSKLVRATVEVYHTVRAELLPTPLKSHYTYNLRDLAAVFFGTLSAYPAAIDSREALLRLWVHELQVGLIGGGCASCTAESEQRCYSVCFATG